MFALRSHARLWTHIGRTGDLLHELGTVSQDEVLKDIVNSFLKLHLVFCDPSNSMEHPSRYYRLIVRTISSRPCGALRKT